jgi:hypothetical protein
VAEDQYVPSTSQQQAFSVTQQVRQDYAQLNSSLQSGDLSAAQSAFASLQQALQSQGTQGTPIQCTPVRSTPIQIIPIQIPPIQGAPVQTTPIQIIPIQGTATTPSTTNSGTDTISNDFNALGSALSSGNLSQAQSAFSQLQNDIQTAQQADVSRGQSLTQGLSEMVKGHHHHHHHGDGSSAESSTSMTDSTDSASTSGLTAGNTGSGVSFYA